MVNEKQLYARALLKHPGEPYKAALSVSGDDLARALIISREWPQDTEVLKYIDEELDQPTSFSTILAKVHIVGFEALAHNEKKVYIKQQLVQQVEVLVNTGKDAIAALKLLAEIEGMTGADTIINNNTLVDQSRVMVVTDHGTDAQWEKKLIDQQAVLTHDGAQSTIN